MVFNELKPLTNVLCLPSGRQSLQPWSHRGPFSTRLVSWLYFLTFVRVTVLTFQFYTTPSVCAVIKCNINTRAVWNRISQRFPSAPVKQQQGPQKRDARKSVSSDGKRNTHLYFKISPKTSHYTHNRDFAPDTILPYTYIQIMLYTLLLCVKSIVFM